MDTDSSSYYETTYSQDERIEKSLRDERRMRERRAAEADLARKKLFEDIAESDLNIFDLPGLQFHTFRHLKIKFSIHPAAISKFVNKNVRFYVSLRYVGEYWRVKRDSLPVNYKFKIYKLFYDKKFFAVDDENIFSVLMKIYEILVVWTQKEEEFRRAKFQRYKRGDEDVELDSDDEQLFLTSDQRVRLYQKRVKVLGRMLPPRTT